MKNNIKVYEENGQKYHFDSMAFQSMMSQKKFGLRNANKKCTKAQLMLEICDKLFVSYDAVKNWAYGKNGPTDLNQIKMIGEFFETDYHNFLKTEDKEMMASNTYNYTLNNSAQAQITKDSVREIYKAMIDYFAKCRDWFYTMKAYDESEKEEEAYRITKNAAHTDLTEAFNRIDSLLEYAMLDLPEQFFKKIRDYMYVDLVDFIDLIAYIGEEGEEEIDEDCAAYIESFLFDAEENLEKRFRYEYLEELRELFSDYIVKE